MRFRTSEPCYRALTVFKVISLCVSFVLNRVMSVTCVAATSCFDTRSASSFASNVRLVHLVVVG